MEMTMTMTMVVVCCAVIVDSPKHSREGVRRHDREEEKEAEKNEEGNGDHYPRFEEEGRWYRVASRFF